MTMDTTTKRSAMPDIVISCFILFVSAGAMALSFTYPPAVSMLLPRLAAGLGIFCAVWMVINKSIAFARDRRDTDDVDSSTTVVGTTEETLDLPEAAMQVDENDAEYVLSHTPRKIWLVTLGFVAGFFVLLYLSGLFIAAGTLSLAYLLVVGKKSWTFAVLYTLVFTALLWALMRWVTYIPSPSGILLHGG
jgi:hypothetical protein